MQTVNFIANIASESLCCKKKLLMKLREAPVNPFLKDFPNFLHL